MNYKHFLSAFAVFFALVACDDVPEPIPPLTLKTRVVEFDAPAGSYELSVESSAGWSAVVDTASASWLSAEKKDGALLLSVTANGTIQDREGSVSLSAGPKTVVISVLQEGITLSATTSRDAVTFAVSGGSVKIDIDASVDWRFESSDEWITADKERGAAGKATLTLSVPANDFFESRTGLAKICFGMKTLASVAVAQDPFVVSTSLSKKSFEANVDGESTTVDYVSNYPWTVSADTWIKVSPAAGEASDAPQVISLTFDEAAALERSGRIVFVAGNVKDTILVHQDKAVAKPIVMDINLYNSSSSKHDAKLAFSESIVSSVASSYDQGVKTLTLKNYSGYSLEYYSSYIGPLMNGTSGFITLPAIVSGKTTNAIRPTEAFAYIKFPAIDGFTLVKVEVTTPSVASTVSFPTYITSTYGTSNAAAKAAALTPETNLPRGATTTYNLVNPVAGTAYYLFMEPTGGTSTGTNGYLISRIILTYNPE